MIGEHSEKQNKCNPKFWSKIVSFLSDRTLRSVDGLWCNKQFSGKEFILPLPGNNELVLLSPSPYFSFFLPCHVLIFQWIQIFSLWGRILSAQYDIKLYCTANALLSSDIRDQKRRKELDGVGNPSNELSQDWTSRTSEKVALVTIFNLSRKVAPRDQNVLIYLLQHQTALLIKYYANNRMPINPSINNLVYWVLMKREKLSRLMQSLTIIFNVLC